MVGSSKILTVSYGTFSCTLEGFDDSFSTMKAIAEYFRDLAADDRYFGAEPPSPDAEMLARIAEREVARRVEARTGSSGIVLRATTALGAPDAAAEQPQAAAPASPAADPSEPGETAGQPALAASRHQPMPPRPKPASAPSETVRPDTDSVAAKLQRIRAVVGRGETPTGLIDDGEEDETLAAGAAAAKAPDAFSEERANPDRDVAAPDAAALESETAGDDAFVDEPLADDAGETSGGPHFEHGRDDIEAETSADVAAPADVEMENATAEGPAGDEAWAGALTQVESADGDLTSDEERTVGTDQTQIAAVPESDPAVEHVEETLEMPGDEAAEPSRNKVADSDPVSAATPEGSEVRAPADRPEPMPLDLSAYFAEHQTKAETADLLTDLMVPADESGPDGGAGAAAEPAAAEPPPPAEPAGPAADGEVQEVEHLPATCAETDPMAGRSPAQPRLVRMSRAEYQARFAAEPEGNVEAVSEDARDVVEDPAGLSPEEEAALMAELAALEVENAEQDDPEAEAEAFWDEAVMAGEAGAEVAPAGPEAGDRADEAAEHRPGRSFVEPEADEASVARLMSRAEGEFAAPEAQSRREAITGLKAAVAAAEAARQLGEERGTADDSEFRNDLRQVVRPRRPEPTTEARSERPRPAPLKLVAAQRVDVAAQPQQEREPVRPRRVTSDETAPESGADNSAFASFAREVGATELSDMLEAAAAYTAYVEGIDDFSRPQLVNKVREIAPDTFSREDELRSFGTLLRQGRIAKVRNGRFQVTESTRFHPERRAG